MEVGEAVFWVRWSRRRRAVTGAEALVGGQGVVVVACRPLGQVRIAGELWGAHCERHAATGETVTVRAVDGLMLLVD